MERCASHHGIPRPFSRHFLRKGIPTARVNLIPSSGVHHIAKDHEREQGRQKNCTPVSLQNLVEFVVTNCPHRLAHWTAELSLAEPVCLRYLMESVCRSIRR